MPGRKVPLINNQVYHVLNKGVASLPIFGSKKDYDRAIQTIVYYRNVKPSLRYSFFINLTSGRRSEILEKMKKDGQYFVEIIAYCLMPNHVHLLLKQLQDDGISIFMSRLSNSYTRYYNMKNKRAGSLFQGKFKAVRMENDEQLLHVSRYIHLNPYSSFLVKDSEHLEDYKFSSFKDYLGDMSIDKDVCQKSLLMGFFKNSEEYRKFVLDQADYQRKLDQIKHKVLEK